MHVPEIVIETDRLILRPPRIEDFDAYATNMADLDAARFIGGQQPRAVAWRGFLASAGAWVIQGFSMFSVIEKSSGRWIGRLGTGSPRLGQGLRARGRDRRHRLGVRSPGLGRGDPFDPPGQRAFAGTRAAARVHLSRPRQVARALRRFAHRDLGPDPRTVARAPVGGMSLLSIHEVAAQLRHTLAACVPDLHRHCADPWVVIGSAAICLAGHTLPVADLDVLTSARDAQSLLAHWHDRRLPSGQAAGADRFRSHFARFAFPGLPVEIMGELEVNDGTQWQRVRIEETRMAQIDGLVIPIPSQAEQLRLLRLFGRDKDLKRADWLTSRKNLA